MLKILNIDPNYEPDHKEELDIYPDDLKDGIPTASDLRCLAEESACNKGKSVPVFRKAGGEKHCNSNEGRK